MARQEKHYHAHDPVMGFERLLGYVVIDVDGKKVGTVKALWEDYTRQPAYLGISTSWLDIGRIHVVPAHFATVSDRGKRIRLPFTEEVVKDAPQAHADAEITLRGETKIRDYFRGKGGPEEAPSPLRREEPRGETADWSASPRSGSSLRRIHEPETLEEEPEPDDDEKRSLRKRISDAVDQGKAEFMRERDREEPLRRVRGDRPIAEPVQPPEARRVDPEPDDFVPLRKPL